MKIAIVKLSALGDIVHAMVALQFIKQHRPDILIDWVVEERFAELLRFNPDIDQLLTVNLKGLKARKLGLFDEIAKVNRFAENRYDLVIDAQGLLKSAITAFLLGNRRAGFNKHSIRESFASLFYQIQVDSPYDSNSIDRNAQVIAEPLGVAISPDQILAKHAFLFFNQPAIAPAEYRHAAKRNILYVIGSTWPSRNYPKEQFLEVINGFAQHALVIWGNDAEREAATWLAERSEQVTVLPKLDLNSLKALIAAMDLVIGNDTGPTHMAWGLNRPSITLFGPTPVSRVYQTPINKVLKSPSIVNPYKLNKQDFSIGAIKPSEIIAVATQLLAN